MWGDVRSSLIALFVVTALGCSSAAEAPAAPEAADADVAAPPASPAEDAGSVEEDPEAVPPADPPAPSPAAPTTLRIMSFNIKNGEIAGHDMGKLTAPLLPSNPDILALQEVDDGTQRSGGLKEAEAIAKAMKMPYSYFGKNFDFDGGAYGLAIVSKLPLSNTHVIRLDDHKTRGNGVEPRIAVAADIVFGNKTITVVSMHASLVVEERAENAARVLKDLGAKAGNAIVMGDMNETPGQAIGDAMTTAGFVDAFHEKHPTSTGFTIPATPVPLRRIDFLFKGKSYGPTVHAWVPAVTTSDHRPVAAVVTLPK